MIFHGLRRLLVKMPVDARGAVMRIDWGNKADG